MKILFYHKDNRNPVVKLIEELQSKDRAKVLACLKCIEELGFDCPRVEFRHVRERLWEIKINTNSIGFRVFYVMLKNMTMILLHAYKKQSQKAPQKDIGIAEKRMLEVLDHEKDYIE